LFSPCPGVLTLHDAIDHAYYAQRSRALIRFSPSATRSRLSLWVARTAAQHIITVSEHSKSDLIRCFSILPSRITVIHEAADPIFTEPASSGEREGVRLDYGLPSAYIMYVGGWERRKNVPFLIRAFSEAQLSHVELVLVGGSPDQCAAMREVAISLGVSDRIKLIGRVSDTALRALYAEALCFVYPSEYEGFGLQLCEAMAVGCPVLAARATSFPEILGDGGVCFNLHDRELVDQLRKIATDADYRTILSEKARSRGEHFSWRKTVADTVSVYQTLTRNEA
jgi:hypothetical protein